MCGNQFAVFVRKLKISETQNAVWESILTVVSTTEYATPFQVV